MADKNFYTEEQRKKFKQFREEKQEKEKVKKIIKEIVNKKTTNNYEKKGEESKIKPIKYKQKKIILDKTQYPLYNTEYYEIYPIEVIENE